MAKQTIRLLLSAIALPVFTHGCVTQNVAIEPSTNTLNILFAGDTSHAESYHAEYEEIGEGNIIKQKGYDYSLAKLKPLLTSSDYVIVNVETPLTSLRTPPFPDKGYNHWSEPELAVASYRRHNIDAVSLANNHTVDFGEEGLNETINTLNDADIAHFGAGANKIAADKPLEKVFQLGQCTLDMVVFGRFEFRDSYEEKYAFYAEENRAGASALHLDELIDDIKAIKKTNANRYIIVFPHWGKNYKWRNEKQERYAKALIDAGADLILGHGAHTLGEIVGIDDALIVYSLGNFIFNTRGRFPANPDVLPMSMVSRLSIAEKDGVLSASMKLYPIFSDNRQTRYQPRFVTRDEFNTVLRTLNEKGTGNIKLTASSDSYGHYIETPLKKLDCR